MTGAYSATATDMATPLNQLTPSVFANMGLPSPGTPLDLANLFQFPDTPGAITSTATLPTGGTVKYVYMPTANGETNVVGATMSFPPGSTLPPGLMPAYKPGQDGAKRTRSSLSSGTVAKRPKPFSVNFDTVKASSSAPGSGVMPTAPSVALDASSKLDTLKQICAEEHRRMDETTGGNKKTTMPSPRTQTAVTSLSQLASLPTTAAPANANINPLVATLAASTSASSSSTLQSTVQSSHSGNVNPLLRASQAATNA